MEIYLYLDMGENNAVFHIMGEPTKTSHIIMHNEGAVIYSAGTSIAGVVQGLIPLSGLYAVNSTSSVTVSDPDTLLLPRKLPSVNPRLTAASSPNNSDYKLKTEHQVMFCFFV